MVESERRIGTARRRLSRTTPPPRRWRLASAPGSRRRSARNRQRSPSSRADRASHCRSLELLEIGRADPGLVTQDTARRSVEIGILLAGEYSRPAGPRLPANGSAPRRISSTSRRPSRKVRITTSTVTSGCSNVSSALAASMWQAIQCGFPGGIYPECPSLDSNQQLS